MTIVVDASALVDAISNPTSHGDWVRGVLIQHTLAVTVSHADLECLNVWRRHVQQGLLETGDYRDLVLQLHQAPIERVGTSHLIPRIAELSPNCTPFDGAYVALAEALNAPLLTCDLRLARSPGPRCTFIVPPTPAAESQPSGDALP